MPWTWKICVGFSPSFEFPSCPVSSVVPAVWFGSDLLELQNRFYFNFFFFPAFALAALGNLTQERSHKRAKRGSGVRDLIFKQLEWFLSFFKKCTCLWYCLSSEMITAPLLYWYNIVHASVVFLYSSLKFINLYCRCYVFLWQNSLQKFFKVF